jgi:hypothetical protein
MTAGEFEKMAEPVRQALKSYTQCGGAVLILGNTELPSDWKGRRSKDGPAVFNYTKFGLAVVSAEADISSWSDELRARIATETWEQSRSFTNKISTVRSANEDFPVVENLGVPVRGLFLLVLIFAVVMGPVNLFFLSRKNKRIWMLWTVPAMAIVASGTIFGFSIVAEGWSGYSKARFITVLDQQRRTATTLGLMGYYCPLTPADGMSFDYETEITVQGMSNSPASSRTINWTTRQHLASGWINARVPSYFLIRKSRLSRARLSFSVDEQSRPVVLNGLGANIKQLWFADEKGNIHYTESLPAGQKRPLDKTRLISTGQRASPDRLRQIYTRNWIGAYDSILSSPGSYLVPGGYVAELSDCPFLEEPVGDLRSRQYGNLVIGMRNAGRGS